MTSAVKYFALLFFLILILPVNAQQKALTFEDIMKFEQIKNPVISDYGNWIGYTAQPDRGNGETIIKSTTSEKSYSIERGNKPYFSNNEKWTAITLLPEFKELEKEKKDKPKNGLVLLNTDTGDTLVFNRVDYSLFSEDSKWLAVKFFKEEKNDTSDSGSKKDKDKKDEENIGTPIVLRNLESAGQVEIPFVVSFGFDSLSHYFSYSVSDTSGKLNGLYLRNLDDFENEIVIDTTLNGNYTCLEWNKNGSLAYLESVFDTTSEACPADLYVWNEEKELLTTSDDSPEGFIIPAKNNLVWKGDGERLFFGYKPEEEKKEKDTTETDIYDIDKILEKKTVEVWHWNDPLIKPNEEKKYKDLKDRTYAAVYHIDDNKVVPLASPEMPYLRYPENPDYAIAYSDVPYLKEITWDGWYYDFYVVNINSGEKEKILEHINNTARLSPDGNFVIYYNDRNWFLYKVDENETRNLTIDLNVPFANEDHDYPSEPPGYGISGWTEDDEAVLIYDKYDIWKFETETGKASNLTEGKGRENEIIYRVIKTNPEQDFFKENEKLLLRGYHDKKKYTGFYSLTLDEPGTNELLKFNDKRLSFIAKAKETDRYLYTKESYTEFPDLWVADTEFNDTKKLTAFGKQIDGFAWGSAELVEWNSLDGIPLQGVLIKPDDYEEGKKYPVIVYFYRFFSQRLTEFSDMVVNHRPNFPFYVSNGYVIFLPDVRFEIGRPGFAATKCIVPGVQKLIEMGIADPDAVGLHGHSWSGYQTAFIVTQTDIFKCAVAGAPVSNMTSAYSGIRWGSGLARQFQYEKTQSRIGGSLWEYPERYIENSPVFFADKINTPLLIMHGDEDDAVPWYQSIELYLALRRNNKEAVFLQYKGEPHHPHKYPNKLDYSIRMKEFFDHYLKNEPAPEWIKEGVPYKE